MKLSKEQKRGCKGIAIFAITNCFVFPLIHLFKGDFTWSDTLLYVGVTIIVAIVVGGFLTIGMRTPKQ